MFATKKERRAIFEAIGEGYLFSGGYNERYKKIVDAIKSIDQTTEDRLMETAGYERDLYIGLVSIIIDLLVNGLKAGLTPEQVKGDTETRLECVGILKEVQDIGGPSLRDMWTAAKNAQTTIPAREFGNGIAILGIGIKKARNEELRKERDRLIKENASLVLRHLNRDPVNSLDC